MKPVIITILWMATILFRDPSPDEAEGLIDREQLRRLAFLCGYTTQMCCDNNGLGSNCHYCPAQCLLSTDLDGNAPCDTSTCPGVQLDCTLVRIFGIGNFDDQVKIHVGKMQVHQHWRTYFTLTAYCKLKTCWMVTNIASQTYPAAAANISAAYSFDYASGYFFFDTDLIDPSTPHGAYTENTVYCQTTNVQNTYHYPPYLSILMYYCPVPIKKGQPLIRVTYNVKKQQGDDNCNNNYVHVIDMFDFWTWASVVGRGECSDSLKNCYAEEVSTGTIYPYYTLATENGQDVTVNLDTTQIQTSREFTLQCYQESVKHSPYGWLVEVEANANSCINCASLITRAVPTTFSYSVIHALTELASPTVVISSSLFSTTDSTNCPITRMELHDASGLLTSNFIQPDSASIPWNLELTRTNTGTVTNAKIYLESTVSGVTKVLYSNDFQVTVDIICDSTLHTSLNVDQTFNFPTGITNIQSSDKNLGAKYFLPELKASDTQCEITVVTPSLTQSTYTATSLFSPAAQIIGTDNKWWQIGALDDSLDKTYTFFMEITARGIIPSVYTNTLIFHIGCPADFANITATFGTQSTTIGVLQSTTNAYIMGSVTIDPNYCKYTLSVVDEIKDGVSAPGSLIFQPGCASPCHTFSLNTIVNGYVLLFKIKIQVETTKSQLSIEQQINFVSRYVPTPVATVVVVETVAVETVDEPLVIEEPVLVEVEQIEVPVNQAPFFETEILPLFVNLDQPGNLVDVKLPKILDSDPDAQFKMKIKPEHSFMTFELINDQATITIDKKSVPSSERGSKLYKITIEDQYQASKDYEFNVEFHMEEKVVKKEIKKKVEVKVPPPSVGLNCTAKIEKIDLFGEVLILFNSSMNNSTNQSHLNESLVDIYIEPYLPYDEKLSEKVSDIPIMNLTWKLINYTQQEMNIKLNLSDTYKNLLDSVQDKLVFRIKKESPLFFCNGVRKQLHLSSWTMERRINTLAPSMTMKFKRNGIILFDFKEPILVPNFEDEKENSTHGRNMMKLSEVDFERDVLKIDLTYFGEFFDRENFNYTVKVLDWNKKQITAYFNFSEPLRLSQGSKLDKLKFSQPKTSLLSFVRTNQFVLEGSTEVDISIPKQLPEGMDEEVLEAQAAAAANSMNSVMLIHLVIQVALKGIKKGILPLFLWMQLIASTELYETKPPANTEIVLENFRSIVRFEILKPDVLINIFFPGLTLKKIINGDFKAGKTELAQQTPSIFDQLQVYILMLIIALIGIIGLLFLKRIKKYREKMQNFFVTQKRKLLFNNTIISLTLTYDSVAGMLVKKLNFIVVTGIVTTSDILTNVVFVMYCFGYPVFCYFLLKRNQNKLQCIHCKQKYGKMFEMIDMKRIGETYYYYSWFITRRLIFTMIPFVIRFSSHWQLMILIFFHQLYIMKYASVFPRNDYKETKLELFNEVMFMLLLYCMICFTDLAVSEEAKFTIGDIYVVIMGCMIASNFYILGLDVVEALKLKLRNRKEQKEKTSGQKLKMMKTALTHKLMIFHRKRLAEEKEKVEEEKKETIYEKVQRQNKEAGQEKVKEENKKRGQEELKAFNETMKMLKLEKQEARKFKERLKMRNLAFKNASKFDRNKQIFALTVIKEETQELQPENVHDDSTLKAMNEFFQKQAEDKKQDQLTKDLEIQFTQQTPSIYDRNLVSDPWDDEMNPSFDANDLEKRLQASMQREYF